MCFRIHYLKYKQLCLLQLIQLNIGGTFFKGHLSEKTPISLWICEMWVDIVLLKIYVYDDPLIDSDMLGGRKDSSASLEIKKFKWEAK